MGDQKYPGVYLRGVWKKLEDDDILRTLGKCLENAEVAPGEKLYSKEGLQMERLCGDFNSMNVVLTGINLTYNQIRECFKTASLGGWPVNTSDVDFGIQRDSTGKFTSHFDLLFHESLKEAQGLTGEILNPFTEALTSNALGNMKESTHRIRIEAIGQRRKSTNPPINVKAKKTVQDLNLGMLSTVEGFLCHRLEYSKADDKGQKMAIATLLEFRYTMDAWQGLRYLNGLEKFSPSGIKFTPELTPAAPGKGIGVGGEVLKITKLMKEHKYIPFNQIDPQFLDQKKYKEEWASNCMYCGNQYTLHGIDPDLHWISATCKCDPAGSCYSWPDEKFFRLTLGVNYARRFGHFQRSDPVEQKLVLFIKGIRPLASSTTDFKRTAYAALKTENNLDKQKLSQKAQLGTICSDTETRQVKNGDGKWKKVFLNMELTTPATDLWCPDGIYRIKSVRLTHRRDNSSQSDLKAQKNVQPIKAYLERITMDHPSIHPSTIAKVELSFWADERFPQGKGEQFVMTPIPSTGNLDAIAASLRKWNKFVSQREKVTLSERLAITIAPSPASEESSLNPPNTRCWNISFDDVTPNWVTNHFLASHDNPEDRYYGVQLRRSSANQYEDHNANFSKPLQGKILMVMRSKTSPQKLTVQVLVQAPLSISNKLLTLNGCDLTMWMGYFDENKIPESLKKWVFLISTEEQEEEKENEQPGGAKQKYGDIIALPFNARHDIRDFLLDPNQPRVFHQEQNKSGSLARFDRDPTNFLNPAQLAGIRGFFKYRVHLVQGPPGTGKTDVACWAAMEYIKYLRSLCQGTCTCLILMTTATNIAADVCFKKLLELNKTTKKPVKIMRMMSGRREEAVDDKDLAPLYLHTAVRAMAHKKAPPKMKKLLQEQETQKRNLMSEKDEREIDDFLARVRNYIMRDTDIIVCTVGTAVDSRISSIVKESKEGRLNAIILDEGSTVTSGQILSLLDLGPEKFMALGDWRQLPPLLTSASALIAGANNDWMHLMTTTNYIRKSAPFTFLNEQYRYPDTMAKVLGEYAYDNRLSTAKSRCEKSSTPCPPRFYELFPSLLKTSIYRITYDASLYRDTYEKSSSSKENHHECYIVCKLMRQMKEAGIPDGDMTVLSMYMAQANLIAREIRDEFPGTNSYSSDSFQGKQTPITILSMVRSNEDNLVGFMRSPNRLTVAISRSTQHLFYISSEETFLNCQIPNVVRFYRIMDEHKIEPIYIPSLNIIKEKSLQN